MPKRSLTAHFGDDCPHQRASHNLWGRADLLRAEDCPVNVYAHKAVECDPDTASDRGKGDAELRPEMKHVWEVNKSIYFAWELRHNMRREGFDLALHG